MFTGIIEELGKVREIKSNKILIESKCVLEDAKIGDSIAVNGVCLTVTNLSSNCFEADISEETLKVTTIKDLQSGSFVNLERAMKASGRFGGHMVSGHIDGIAKLIGNKQFGDFYELSFELEPQLAKFVIRKGSIAINGISLTIANLDEFGVNTRIIVAIIPHTYENTNLKELKIGDFVNIETDLVAKYIEKFLLTSDNKSRITLDFLQEHGF